MARQSYVKPKSRSKPRPTRVETPESTKAKSRARLKADLDALLDEVDGVLEENAEDFVAGYIQKGGE